jgi:HEAT repeat protein
MAMRTTAVGLLLLVLSGARPATASGPAAQLARAAQVASLLSRFPASSFAQRDALCAEVLELGPAGVAAVLARALPPGKEDDSKARFAVGALVACAGRPGAERERALVARALVDAADAARDADLASFFLSQVELVGKDESVRPLARFLADERLAGPASRALVTIGGPRASKALLDALGKAPLGARPAIVQALGKARVREAVPRLLPLAQSEDEGLRQAALFALANLGDPAAGPVLSRTRVAASHRERAQAPSLYLLHARRLAENGRTAEAVAAARAVLQGYTGADESRHAAEALFLLVGAQGAQALPDLLSAARSPDRERRGAALGLAPRIPGSEATARWVDLARTAPADVRADVVAMLGARGDAAALPFVRENLGSPDEAVRLAAIPAARRLGGESVLSDLVALLAKAGEAEASALRTALLGYPAPVVVPEAARLLDATPAPAKAALVDVLGGKGARDEIERVYRLVDDPDPHVSEAALRALGSLAGEADLPRLVSMLEAETASDRIVRLREAIASAVLRHPDRERGADALVALMRSTSRTGTLEILKVLPRVGGAAALAAAAEAAGSADAEIQAGALSALSRWPDTTAAPELLKIARATSIPEHFRTALQGYARLVARSDLRTWKKMEAFEAAMALPGADEDKKPVLTAIAFVREPESLRVLARFLDAPGLRDAAATAILDLLSRRGDQDPWLSGHEAYSVLRRVEAAAATPAVRERAARVIAERLRQGGFVPLAEGATTRDFGDFELLVDVKAGPGGDPGIRLRGVPLARILEGAKSEGKSAPRPAGEWSEFRIFVLDGRVTVYRDDERLVDDEVLEGASSSGPIVLGEDGRAVRNVHVREIPREVEPPASDPSEAAEGFVPLFNGRDLEGWTGKAASYAVEDGRIVVHPEKGGGNLYTAREYSDFVLRFEFRLTPAANNGIGIRAPLEGDAAYAGMEIQVLEDGSPVYWGLQPYQHHGSVYGVVPAKRGVLLPVGEWNRQEITAHGRRVSVVVNGVTVVDADLDAASAGGTMDGKDHPGLARRSGHIGFLGHASRLEFRNIRIREIR